MGDDLNKSKLRSAFLKRRTLLDKRMYTLFNTMLVARLKTYLETRHVERVGIFYPMLNEVDLRSLSELYTVYLPKIVQGGIVFYEDRGDYQKAPFNTTVPAHDEAVDKALLDVVIVPGIVFDKLGYRIGYGKGYYDMFLKDFQGEKIGVCFDLFVIDKIPVEDHDIAVDMVITDQQAWKG